MEREPMVVTTVRVPQRIWLMLRALSEARALEVGGRPSVSALLVALTEEKAAARKTARNEGRYAE
jgi:hypothetical protein